MAKDYLELAKMIQIYFGCFEINVDTYLNTNTQNNI